MVFIETNVNISNEVNFLMLYLSVYNIELLAKFALALHTTHRSLLDKPQKNLIHSLTLKAPITTAVDDIHKYFFIVFQRK